MLINYSEKQLKGMHVKRY